MRNLVRSICCGMVVLLLASASRVRAEDQTGRWGIGGFGGAAIPTGSKFITDNADTFVDAGAHLRYGMSPHWSAMVAYDNMYFKKNIRVEDITVSALYHPCPESRWNPFLRFGWGVASGQGAKNFNDFAGVAGLGFEYFVTSFFAVGPAVTYHYDSKTGDSLNETHAIVAGLMGTLSFGGAPSAPKMAKAPEADTDGDGVLDGKDECPGTPAGAKVDKDGCPVDSDKDGVLDYMDKCPDTPKGTQVDGSGCPPQQVKDSDGDGVADDADRCTDTPKGTPVNSVGCPQLKPEEKVSIQMNILFDSGKAVVKPEFDAEIKKVADFMNNYPEVNAVIEGHTDNVGSEALNVSLSQKRADAVSQYLTSKFGVPASRLSAKGFGPSKPVADNATPAGRAQNRRVVATLEAVKK